jgi:hypothetical protein
MLRRRLNSVDVDTVPTVCRSDLAALIAKTMAVYSSGNEFLILVAADN